MAKKKKTTKSSRSTKKGAAEKKAIERSLNKARAAKSKALEMFKDIAEVNGVGLTRQEGKYAVRINLEEELGSDVVCPQEIGGVPVVVKVVGKIKKQTAQP